MIRFSLAAGIFGALLVAGCAQDTTDEKTSSNAAVPRGVYTLDGAEGDMLVLAFLDAEHYWSWKATDACLGGDAPAVDTCAEQGRYVVNAHTLTLTTDAGQARSLPFEVGPAVSTATLTTRAGLVNGEGSSLVSGVSALTAGTVSVAGRLMSTLLDAPSELLCTPGDMSGAVPGARSPSANYSNGRFTSGEFAPGGRYDPSRIPAGAQSFGWNLSSAQHHYVVFSDYLPAGTTYAQAGAALQRFNAPTVPAITGYGDNPNAQTQMVMGAGGCVSVERGNGWARNTTQELHPFVGTITRYVVDAGNGRYRILTVGDGRTNPNDVSLLRNAANLAVGPATFELLDVQLSRSLR